MSKYIYTVLVFYCLISCDFFNEEISKKESTFLEIEDVERHYYPIIRGQELHIAFKIKNIGNAPLFITEVQPSCGCIDVDYPIYISEGGSSYITMKYDSGKNLGYVASYIDVFANTDSIFKYTLKFDVNVVTNADYTKDYEEIYHERLDKENNDLLQKWVEGDETQKGYFIDIDKKNKY